MLFIFIDIMIIIKRIKQGGGINHMQYKKKFLLLIVILIILTSCQQNDDSVNQGDFESDVQNELLDTQEKESDSLAENLDVQYNFTITGESPDEFEVLILNNPIDLRRKELLEDYDGSSRMTIEVASKYEEFWNIEMEAAYSELLDLLDGDDRQKLISSQTSWENYMESKKNIEISFFKEQKYNTCGTLREALAIDENADETKARAYDLLEYLYFITGEIKMVFSSDEW